MERVTVWIDETLHLSTIDERYLSFAIDSSQLVGGKWWNPAANRAERRSGEVRAPLFDFARPRLRALTRSLSPAYLRLGGSEADRMYYDVQTGAAEGGPPPLRYASVLT